MVRKFLTREQTYSQLLMAVSESERKIDKLKKDNEELRSRLHELQIDVTDNAAKAGGNSMMDEEIIEMNGTLDYVKKDHSALMEKFKRINIVNDQVSGWARRVFGKFAALVDNPNLAAGTTDISKIFEGMSIVVCEELKRLIERQ